MKTSMRISRDRTATALRGFLSVLVWLSLSSCGADGGPIGTGIFASVSGNVIETGTVLSAADETPDELGAALSTDGVRVSIEEVPDATTETGTGGSFALEGDFSGDLTLVFETDDIVATASVEVPVGAALVLSDIELRSGDARPGAIQTLNVLGTVREIDCGSGEMSLRERAHDRRLRVLLDENTAIVDARTDEPQSCTSLERGATVLVGGTPEPGERTLNADLIRTRPSATSRPPEREPVRFHGVVRQQRCGAGILAVENRNQTLRIRITGETVLETRDGQPATCPDFTRNTLVQGKGTVDLRAPGVTQASRITLLGERDG